MSREIVQGVLNRFTDADLTRADAVFDAHRRSFLPHVIDALPGGRARWGVLRKSGGSIPSDIVVDKDDMHYDVFSGQKLSSDPLVWKLTATWQKVGNIKDTNTAWRWMSLDEAGIVPYARPDAPPKPPVDPPADTSLAQRVAALEAWARSFPK